MVINNSLSLGVIPKELLFIKSPVHGMFYRGVNGVICFMRSNDIPNAPTDHLFHLRLVCMYHGIVDFFHFLLYFQFRKRREELVINDYKWIKTEIINDV